MASCPCHVDKTPSLAIADNVGKILLHCFSRQCTPIEICDTIGLNISDLFPPDNNYEASQHQRREYYDSQQVLDALAFETLVASIILQDLMDSGSLFQTDLDRLWVATERINAGLEYTRRLTA
jgi:hypothetical protein